jgi:phytanoyl-CoA hydroxylase
MTLTTAQVEQFRTYGYVAMPTFFDAEETAAIRAEVERLQREGLLRNVATDGDGATTSQTKRNLQLCPMFDKSTLFRALPFAPKVTEAVGQLLGDPVVLRLDQVFLKPAHDGAGTNWHQDNAYFQISNPLKGTALWIAVHEATVENGTLHIIPDAFTTLLEHSRDTDSDHHIRCYPDESQAVPIELPAGGVVFFAYGTPHCTLRNRSDADRAGAAFHFVNASCFAEDPALRANVRSDYYPILTGPDSTGGAKEYGTVVAGTWPAEVAQALAHPTERSS